MSKLSIVVPAYNEEGLIESLVNALADVLKPENISYELLLVDDGSRDGTWTEIEEAHALHPEVRGISFSRNFGKEAAIFAGLQYAQGDAIAVMDCDLQHPPATLIKMYRLWEQGFEVVNATKASRGKESFLHLMAAKIFNNIFSNVINVDMSTSSDFKLMDAKVVKSLIALNERHIFFRGLSAWAGYKTTQVDFDVAERTAGVTKWGNAALLRYALKNISSFSTFPLQFVSFMGSAFALVAFIIAVQSLYNYFSGKALGGFTTVIMLILATGSIIMISLGILGGYIARIYTEVQHRPRFIVSQTTPETTTPKDTAHD